MSESAFFVFSDAASKYQQGGIVFWYGLFVKKNMFLQHIGLQLNMSYLDFNSIVILKKQQPSNKWFLNW